MKFNKKNSDETFKNPPFVYLFHSDRMEEIKLNWRLSILAFFTEDFILEVICPGTHLTILFLTVEMCPLERGVSWIARQGTCSSLFSNRLEYFYYDNVLCWITYCTTQLQCILTLSDMTFFLEKKRYCV